MVRVEQLPKGARKCTSIANFTARIVADLIRDDGDEQRRDFRVEAEVDGQRLVFDVAAAEFGRMGWVLQKLGPQAIIYPGQQQHARAAMQVLSGAIPQELVFTHPGWRRHGPQWVSLHGTGALGADGPVFGLQVHLPAALRPYELRRPANGDGVWCVRCVPACGCFPWHQTRSPYRCWLPPTERPWGGWTAVYL